MTQQSRPERRVAWLIILLGVGGIVLALLWPSLNISLGAFTIDPAMVLLLAVIYVVVGFVLLILPREEPQEPPVAPAQPLKTTTQSVPRVAPQPAPKAVTGPLGSPPPRTSSMPPARDDLTVLEGVGPKTQEALNKAGIYTYAHVAETSPEELYRIVRIEHGVQIVGQATETWPKQAAFLAKGDVPGFKAYVDHLKAGRE